jgi:hypothetical protein
MDAESVVSGCRRGFPEDFIKVFLIVYKTYPDFEGRLAIVFIGIHPDGSRGND